MAVPTCSANSPPSATRPSGFDPRRPCESATLFMILTGPLMVVAVVAVVYLGYRVWRRGRPARFVRVIPHSPGDQGILAPYDLGHKAQIS